MPESETHNLDPNEEKEKTPETEPLNHNTSQTHEGK